MDSRSHTIALSNILNQVYHWRWLKVNFVSRLTRTTHGFSHFCFIKNGLSNNHQLLGGGGRGGKCPPPPPTFLQESALGHHFNFYPRQKFVSGIVVSGKNWCPSSGRHTFVSGPLFENHYTYIYEIWHIFGPYGLRGLAEKFIGSPRRTNRTTIKLSKNKV